MTLLFAAAATAAGAWAVVALESGTLPGGTALIVGAAAALMLTITHGRECLRVSRLALREMEWEAHHD